MDGTMATTLAPSEDEMTKVTEVFAKMRDAVIDASKLAQEVAELRSAVEGMQRELASLRDSNRWLDQQVTELREQRDTALREKHEVLSHGLQLQGEVSRLQAHGDSQRAELARLNERVTGLLHDNDMIAKQAWATEEENKALKAKLEAIQAVFGRVESAAPQPVSYAEVQPRAETGQWAKPNQEADEVLKQEHVPDHNDPICP